MWRISIIKSEHPVGLQVEWEKSNNVIRPFSFGSQLIIRSYKVLLRNINSNVQAGISMISSMQKSKGNKWNRKSNFWENIDNLLSYYGEAINKLNISMLNTKITIFYIIIYKKKDLFAWLVAECTRRVWSYWRGCKTTFLKRNSDKFGNMVKSLLWKILLKDLLHRCTFFLSEKRRRKLNFV